MADLNNGIDVLDFGVELPTRNPLFTGDIGTGTLTGNAGEEIMGATSIWDQIGDFTQGIGGAIATGFDVFNDVTGRDDDPGPAGLTQQQMLLIGAGLLVLVLVLARR